MKVKEINWVGVGVRFLLALLLVFATYNPSGYSYFDWGIKNIADFSILKLFAGVVLLIGWAMFIRATLVSLGPFGITLAVAFFGTLLWLVVDWGLIPASSVKAVTYLILVAASAVLATGMTWSHIRRRLSGQLDVDETDVD
ncbi:MAG: DUF6524 family protein [Gammaproteobacteria bacterium]